MKFNLRTLFVTILMIALVFGLIAFLERSWFAPGRIGRVAQEQLDGIFADHNWDGYAASYFYDCRVRIVSPDIGDSEIHKLYPVLHELPWLRHVELYGTSLTAKGVSSVESEFPNCHIDVHEHWP